jgi:hypothetical protein
VSHQQNQPSNCSIYIRRPTLLTVLLLGLGAPSIGRAQSTLPEKAVNALYRMSEQPMGTYTEKRSMDVAGNIVTMIDSDMVFNRLGNKLELKSTSHYVETPGGALVTIDNVSSSSQQATTVHATVNKNSIGVTTEAGGHSYVHSIALSKQLLGPEAARQLVAAHLRAVGDVVAYETFSPEVGNVVTITDEAVALDDTPKGQEASGIKIKQTMSGMAAPLTLWVDSSGWMLGQTMGTPLGDIEAVRSDAALVDITSIGGASLPSETFNRSIVNANIRLPEERLIEKIKLKIITRHPEVGWPNFSADNQTVLEKTRDYVVLEVRRSVPRAEGSRPAAMTNGLRPYLEPNALLQSDDAGVRQIEGAAVHYGDTAWQAARALQRWTADNMHFDLGIAIVPASEVAKDRAGTCFGYSILLGSLARAAGIPSRVRIGLVYAGGIWDGHAWPEVLIGDQWIPIDGALYAPGPADAARFSVYTSSLEDGTVGTLGGLGQVLGNVDIKILEYTVGGRRTVVDEHARPYSIEGNIYRNPWIGLSVAKPTGFRFTGFDLAWPQTTVIAMEGPGGQRAEIHNESESLPTSSLGRNKLLQIEGISGPVRSQWMSGHVVAIAGDEKGSGMIIENAGSIWLVKATGPRSEVLLREVASSMKLVTNGSVH